MIFTVKRDGTVVKWTSKDVDWYSFDTEYSYCSDDEITGNYTAWNDILVSY